MSNSRRASRPATRKKNAISPEFTHSRRSAATPAVPIRTDRSVPQAAAYPDESMFAQASAASVAASSTAALPVSVRRNRRSGVSRCSAHAVLSENGEAEALDPITPESSPAPLDPRQDGASDGPAGRAPRGGDSGGGHAGSTGAKGVADGARALEPVSEPTGGELDGLPGRSEGRRPADQAAPAVPPPGLGGAQEASGRSTG